MSSRSRDERRMLIRLSLMSVAAALEAYRAISSLRSGTDCHSPRSKEARMSSSYFLSLVFIVTVLFKISSGRNSTWDDGLQEYFFICFHERNQICVATNTDYEHALIWVSFFVWMFNNIKKSTVRDCSKDLLERDTSSRFESNIFF